MDINAISVAARDAAQRGDWSTAERLWEDVRRLDPNNAAALFSLGVHAMQRRDFNAATSLMEAACAASPGDAMSRLTLGVIRRELNDLPGELAAIDAALAIDAYFLPAILAKGAWLERQGMMAGAALYYRSAVKFAPPEQKWPDGLRPQLSHARSVADKFSATMERHLNESMKGALSSLPLAARARWQEAASIMAGRSEPYRSQCNQLHVPRLPAVPFFDVSLFPWVATIEAATAHIRAELLALLEEDGGEQFQPYVAYKPGAPVNQWKELNHSPRWSAFHLWRAGQAVAENLARCPRTAEALEAVGMASIDGLCPNAMFSALAPHTHIPPHNGETNARVVAHLPLIVPDGCSYRVGFDTRLWEEGKVLVFDDTIEHEARNDSDHLRVVLIFDVWNPFLSNAERELVCELMAAARRIVSPETNSAP